jgi:hypothetical protein
MSKARLIITAVVVEGRPKSEVARDYEVSRYWVQQLVKRWYAEGEAAYQPRSRRPRHSPHAVPAAVEDQARTRSAATWPAAPRGRYSMTPPIPGHRTSPGSPRSPRSGGS